MLEVCSRSGNLSHGVTDGVARGFTEEYGTVELGLGEGHGTGVGGTALGERIGVGLRSTPGTQGVKAGCGPTVVMDGCVTIGSGTTVGAKSVV
jgi:hypothetical protein